MESGNAKEKAFQKHDSWIPVTPANPIAARQQPLSVGRDRKNHQNQTFPPETSQEIKAPDGEHMSFNFMVSNDQNRGLYNWDWTPASEKEKQTCNGFDPVYLINLDTNVQNWEKVPSIDSRETRDLSSGFREAAIAGKQETQINNETFTCFGSSSSREPGRDNLNWKALEGTKDMEFCTDEIAKCFDVMGSGKLNRGLDVCDTALVGWDHITFTELLGLRIAAPPVTLASDKATSQGTFDGTTSIFPVPHSQVDSIIPEANSGSFLLTNHNSSLCSNQRNNTNIPASQIPQYHRPNKGKDKQKDVVPCTGNEDSKLHHNGEHSQPTVEVASTAVSTPAEKHNANKRPNDRIDLNKKPRQRQREKKHRPKVVVEGKPKRTPKPTTPKRASPENNPLAKKRKYVRKNSVKASITPSEDVLGEAIDPTPEPAVKSCKRALNFKLENHSRDENAVTTVTHQYRSQNISVEKSSCKRDFNLILESPYSDLCTGINDVSGTDSTVQLDKGKELMVENTAGMAYELTRSSNLILPDYKSLTERDAAITAPPTEDPPRENLSVLSGNINERTVSPSQNRGENSRTAKHQSNGENMGKVVYPAETVRRKPALMLQSDPNLARNPSASKCINHGEFADTKHAERSTGDHCNTTNQNNPRATNQTGCQYNSLRVYQRILRENEFLRNSRKLGPNFPKVFKKKRISRRRKATKSSTLHSSIGTEIGQQQVIARSRYNVTASPFTLRTTNGQLIPQFTPKILHNGNGISDSGIADGNFQIQKSCMAMLSPTEAQTRAAINNLPSFKCMLTSSHSVVITKKKRSKVFTRRGNLAFLTAIPNCNQLPPTPLKQAHTGERQEIETFGPEGGMDADNHEKRVMKRQSKMGSPLVNAVFYHNKSEECQPELEDVLLTAKLKGPQEVLQREIIELLIQRIKYLHISNGSGQLIKQDTNAHDPQSKHGALVPYEGTKKRQQQPKVDLDPETMRVWKLLMENDGSEGVEEVDKDKEKWWVEERKVFHGRVDSFIARMHLIQGNRRFSPWKGSVLDSALGVFLTQNVSDHLSSSAFMSLAARFPLQSTSNQAACYEDRKISSNQESIGSNIGAVGAASDTKDKQLLVCETEQDMSYELAENKTETLVTRRGRASLAEAEDRRALKGAISAQKFVGSSTFQSANGIQICSNSTLETDLTTRCKPNNLENSTASTELLQLEETATASLQEFYCHESEKLSCHENQGGRYTESRGMEYGKQTSSSDSLNELKGTHASICLSDSHNPHLKISIAPSSVEVDHLDLLGDIGNTKTKNLGHISENLRLMEDSGSEIIFQKKVLPIAQEAIKCSSQAEVRIEKIPHNCNDLQGGKMTNFQSESMPVDKPKSLVDGMVQSQNSKMQPSYDTDSKDKKKQTGNRPNLNEQIYSSGIAFNERKTATLRRKKRNIEEKKDNTVDWDSLRTSYSNGRERSSDTMDSLDWEAVRCAKFKEVSETISDRGMNNVLAARIKDFLDRMVREHGSIDLEWLRDVPPDKAKDYLLSIRGLGLKSVECVRLLTLQHLAFPVDTNVGRIAVRLGWVPLQPLDEKLQIHLLNQYPLMDSIQKYLWPRLCTLDQRTLYELHYQMITFGKVFCTKKNPNCNACPMRGECKHFASAFASARLALPGPQEKSTVSSKVPVAAAENLSLALKPASLSLPEGHPFSESKYRTKNCEPIIEVPASPETGCTEIPERDIEDFFNEDSDEIPTIKLNIEEFKENLHSYMDKNNMLVHQGDMSKALVAVTSEAASIPMRKLKYISRLRTEHQVYELPDSHPLLAGLNRREPDDQCPYLLAIWTPAETSNSFEPPKRRCDSQESGELCNEKTCFPCHNIQEQTSLIVRGSFLIPCRTAMRGSFPLNGTYFQVNEVFADDESSQHPIDVPREWIWNLPRRTLYCGTSTSGIFKGLSTEEIQYCFWRGFVCVRGFNQKTRAPKALASRFHIHASKTGKMKSETNDE